MARIGVTYEQVAHACQTILEAKRHVTARGILARTGGSLSTIGKHLQQWRRERGEEISPATRNMKLSPRLEQALRDEFVRKTAQFRKILEDRDELLTEAIELLGEAEVEKEKLTLELSEAKNKIIEQDKLLAITDQRLMAAESLNKELQKSIARLAELYKLAEV